MFDYCMTKITQPKNIKWVAPNKILLEINDEDGLVKHTLLKGACEYLHNQIDIKQATSKEIYKKVGNLWEQLRDIQLSKCMERPRDIDQFSLDKDTVVYLTTPTDDVVDIEDLKTIDNLIEFKDIHQDFILELSTIKTTRKFFQESKGGLFKFVCYDKNYDIENREYTPIVIIEMNYEKSTYKVYTGILIYKTFTFVPSLYCLYDDNRLYDFIVHFDMNKCVEQAEMDSDALYECYENALQNPTEISVREVTAFFKAVGYKLELDDLNALHPVDGIIDDDCNKMIQDFYNTFIETTGETALDILQLSDFRKTFRYNKLTLLDMLNILSKGFLTYSGSKITTEILGDIVSKMKNINNADKGQVTIIESEQNNM